MDNNTDLFRSIDFKSHAGLDLSWKIEMDALSENEWFTIARMILEISPPFHSAIGIPRGGMLLGELLNKYGTGNEEDPFCIVDDVLTTGKSMIDYREEMNMAEELCFRMGSICEGKTPKVDKSPVSNEFVIMK